MRAVVTGDWHLDRVTAGLARFDEVAAAVDQTVETAIAERVDLYVFLGDLANPGTSRSLRAVAFAAAVAMRLGASGIHSLWLPGNHDVVEDGYGTSSLSPLARLPFATVLDQPGLVPVLVGELKTYVDVLALPFTPRSHTYSPEEVVQRSFERGRKPKLIVGHLTIPGMAPGSEVLDMPRGRDVLYPYEECVARFAGVPMFNGHYHCGGEWRGPGVLADNAILMPGSLARLTFGERASTPGFLVLELEGGAA